MIEALHREQLALHREQLDLVAAQHRSQMEFIRKELQAMEVRLTRILKWSSRPCASPADMSAADEEPTSEPSAWAAASSFATAKELAASSSAVASRSLAESSISAVESSPAAWLAAGSSAAAEAPPPEPLASHQPFLRHDEGPSCSPVAKLVRDALPKLTEKISALSVDVSQMPQVEKLLNEPLSAKNLAKAFDITWAVRWECGQEEDTKEKLGKEILKLSRELLCLYVGCSNGNSELSKLGFESQVMSALGRDFQEQNTSDSILLSQMELSRKQICRIGMNKILFNKEAPNIFGKLTWDKLTTEDQNNVFATYSWSSAQRPRKNIVNDPSLDNKRVKCKKKPQKNTNHHFPLTTTSMPC